MLKKFLTNIANTFREFLGTDDTINAQDFPQKINAVYEKGRVEFSNTYQNNGNRKDYAHAFRRWTKEYFDMFGPTQDITAASSAEYAFEGSNIQVHLDDYLNSFGIKFMTTGVQGAGLYYTFANSKFLSVGEIDASEISGARYTFQNCINLTKIVKFIISKKCLDWNTIFTNCTALKEIVIEGEIAVNTNFMWAPLLPESMKSVILHLVNYSGTDNEGVYTVKFSEDCWIALEADSAAPDGGTWKDYVNNLGWNT